MEIYNRKPNRLKKYDYSQNGAYFITICVQDRKTILSRIGVRESGFPPELFLLPFGKIAQAQLMELPKRYSGLVIDHYVIMPNHIHILMRLENVGGASPSPTISDIICTFKSLTIKECRSFMPIKQLFQRSYYDHIIRDMSDYQIKWQYIDNNPAQWFEDSLNEKDNDRGE